MIGRLGAFMEQQMAEKSLDRWYKELLFYVERTEKAEKNEWNLRGKKT